MSHRIKRDWKDKLRAAVPFGLGQTKPQHFRDMGRIIWKNKDNLPYAWKVLSRGVCDGCALGVAGFHDWTIKGVHLCMTRLNLLRLNTMPAFEPELLADASKLRHLSNAELREMGRIPYPFLRRKGDAGFQRIHWEEAYGIITQRIRASAPRRIAFFVTSRGITNEVYYVAQKVARFLGTNNVDNAASMRLAWQPPLAVIRIGGALTCWFFSARIPRTISRSPRNTSTRPRHMARKW
jgi:hypothetical protein